MFPRRDEDEEEDGERIINFLWTHDCQRFGGRKIVNEREEVNGGILKTLRCMDLRDHHHHQLEGMHFYLKKGEMRSL